MRDSEKGEIYPYILVLKWEGYRGSRWNILKPDGTFYRCSSKAMAWTIAKSWAKELTVDETYGEGLHFFVDSWFPHH